MMGKQCCHYSEGLDESMRKQLTSPIRNNDVAM